MHEDVKLVMPTMARQVGGLQIALPDHTAGKLRYFRGSNVGITIEVEVPRENLRTRDNQELHHE